VQLRLTRKYSGGAPFVLVEGGRVLERVTTYRAREPVDSGIRFAEGEVSVADYR